MELVKKNVHLSHLDLKEELQIPLEDVVNLPETKPDIAEICMEKGTVIIDEIRSEKNFALLKGKLAFCILYYTQENGGCLERTEGKIAFEEKIRMEGLNPSDVVAATGNVDDLTVEMINTRKLSVQSVITLRAEVDGIYDEELPVEVAGRMDQGDAQLRRNPVDYAQLIFSKREVLRVKEALPLPSGAPNIGRLLWKNASLGEMSFRLGEERLYVQGEVLVFVLYEPEEGGMPQTYETVANFSSELACAGCREGETLDVRYGVLSYDVTAEPDFDGEQRELGLDVTVGLRINVYAEERTEVVRDVYGVTQELTGEKRSAKLRRIVRSMTGKTKVTDHLRLDGKAQGGALVHGEGGLGPVEVKEREGGVTLRGSLCVKLFYATGEESPYGYLRKTIPYEYSLEIHGMEAGDVIEPVQVNLEQLSVSLKDGEEVDVKAILSFGVTAFHEMAVEVLNTLHEEPLDARKMASLPGMAVYLVREGDDLWSIGKRYYVPMQTIREFNDVSGDVTPGQKLLIVKGTA